MALNNTINTALLWPLSIKVLQTLREEAGILNGLNTEFDPAPGNVGETVTVGLSVPLSVGTVTPSPYLAAFPADMTLKYQQVSLANWDKAEFALSTRDIEKIRIAEWKPVQLVQAVRSVLNSMRQKVYLALLQTNGAVHTTQTTGIFNSTDEVSNIIDAKEKLTEQLAPQSGKKMLVISPKEEGNALKLAQWRYAYAAGDPIAFRQGHTGQAFGFEFHVDNSGVLPQVYANGTDNGAYTLNGAHAAGSTSLTVQVGAGTILAGNSIEVTDATTGSKYTYAVKTTLAANVVEIYEPGLMVTNATGSTVKLVGTASTNIHVGGFAFDPNAIVLVNRPPRPHDVELGVSQIVKDPLTDIALKFSIIPGDEAVIYRVSCLYGVGVADPRLGCRITFAS